MIRQLLPGGNYDGIPVIVVLGCAWIAAIAKAWRDTYRDER